MKNIYCIVGESGTGKSYIVSQLCKKHKLTELCSYTTREPRDEDEQGHIFITGVSPAQIHKRYPNIVAETLFNGHMYWCTQEQVEQSDLYIIDPAGLDFFKKTYHGNKKIKTIYLRAAAITRRLRMKRRGDDEDQIEARILHDRTAFAEAEKMADFVVWNDSAAMTVDKIWEYIQEQESKRRSKK